MTAQTPHRYQEPGWFTRNVLNKLIAGLTGLGVSVLGSRVLAVRGRKSGEWRTTPVNLLIIDGQRYLVSPRGHTQWVRNLRVAREGELRLGRARRAVHRRGGLRRRQAGDLRAYLARWKAEVGVFFAGVGPDASDAELRRISPDHPVFKISSPS